MSLINGQNDELLRLPNDLKSFVSLERKKVGSTPCVELNDAFLVNERKYSRQYADIYFTRLTQLRSKVSKVAIEAWKDFTVAGQVAQEVERILDVKQGELCWITGTVYKDMPLKPNVLEDLARDHLFVAPPPRQKYVDGVNDTVLLEDDSGRVRLFGHGIQQEMLVTGCIISVLGSETTSGDFETIGICLPEMAPQRPRQVPGGGEKKYVAIASGLNISGNLHESYEVHLLQEFLTGELLSGNGLEESASIVRLIIAGNSTQASQLTSADMNGGARTVSGIP